MTIHKCVVTFLEVAQSDGLSMEVDDVLPGGSLSVYYWASGYHTFFEQFPDFFEAIQQKVQKSCKIDNHDGIYTEKDGLAFSHLIYLDSLIVQ